MKKQLFVLTLLCFFFCLRPAPCTAQFFSSGQDPASIQWKQINSEFFQVVFPEGFEEQAQYIINILDTVYTLNTSTYSVKPGKISLIIHLHSVSSNAFVGWAPKRIEYFNVPPQDSYAEEWFSQLGLHEFRHVVQISQMDQGLTKVLSYILGQQGSIAIVGLYIPFWFLEGDAVFAETYHSYSGRGRVPSFTMPLKAQLSELGLYSYDKAVLGSYRNYIPNHYVLGYHLVAHGYQKYGNGIWNNILKKVARNPYGVVPFSNGIKKNTGFNKTGYYRETMNELNKYWTKQIKSIHSLPVRHISGYKSDVFTSYRYPHQVNPNGIIAIRSSLNDITRIVMIDSLKNERVIISPGLISSHHLSYSGEFICWAEKNFDPRWTNKGYSNIYVHNIKTGKTRQLTHKSRFFAPELSNRGDQIAAVEVGVYNDYRLVIIDVETGEVVTRVETDENYFIQIPSWSSDDREIVLVLLGKKGKCFAVYNLHTKTLNQISEFTFQDIAQPLLRNDSVFFTGPYNGTDNIYLFDIRHKTIHQITDVKYGARDASFSTDGNQILFSQYNASGYQVVSLPLTNGLWRTVSGDPAIHCIPFPMINDPFRKILDAANPPKHRHEVKNYNRFSHLFNIHSWSPYYFNIDNQEFKPGITLLSQNKLSTSVAGLGWEYNRNEETGAYVFDFSYLGWYPIIDLKFTHGKRKRFVRGTQDRKIRFSYFQTTLQTSIRIPLRIVSNQYIRGIQPQFTFKKYYQRRDPSADSSLSYRSFQSVEYSIYLFNRMRMSYRDLYPRWGQSLNMGYSHVPFENDKSSVFYSEVLLFFPGVLRNQSFRAYVAAEIKQTDKYLFGNTISYPRGFSQLFYPDLYSLKLDYRFPVCYPDLSLSSLVYVKRIKAGFFFDYAIGVRGENKDDFTSLGMEVRADVHLLRFLAPFDLGIRAIFLPQKQRMEYEFLFAIDFEALY